MLKKLKQLLNKGRGENISTPSPVSIDDYLEEIEEIPISTVEEEKITIKVCSIEDEKDAINAIVLAEAGYIVIAKTPNLEKEIDDEFVEIIRKMRNEVAKFGGMLLALGDEHLLITPKNVIIEKLIKEKKENKSPFKSVLTEKEEEKEDRSEE
ncbi:MAG: cell division protein SepF [Methanococci archaeon]|nr:cell division protein SepF [Methanococci archaeon]